MPTSTTVYAAGAVLWRRSAQNGGPELALVHRPKYDDWSFPKGKLNSGEHIATAALREVKEETGFDCELGAPLPSSHYLVDGRAKEVHYWAATPAGGVFAPSSEVDRMVWLDPASARTRLTHDRDRPLVDALLRSLGADGAGPFRRADV